MENKSNHKKFVHLVGLYIYCKMMHGIYNVKHTEKFNVGPLIMELYVLYIIYASENYEIFQALLNHVIKRTVWNY